MSLFLKYPLFGIKIPYKAYRVRTETFNTDPLVWAETLERHHLGQFSVAGIQSNKHMEDRNQVDVSHDALFVGIYDGFKGNEAASYIRRHIFKALLRRIKQNNNNMTVTILRQAIEEIEQEFFVYAREWFEQDQGIVRIGLVSSGCLICFIWRGTLYLANVGNSRAVLGFQEGAGLSKKLRVQQMVRDHSCENLDVRNELHALHPDENNFCQLTEVHPLRNPSWTVKGLIETSRCIGYAYMKKVPFTEGAFEIDMRERVVSDFAGPILTSEPEVYSRVLNNTDRFIIFGSSGFWKFMSNELAAKIFNSNPRDDIAKKLAIIAIEKGAKKKESKYSDIVVLCKGFEDSGNWGMERARTRPIYHDDMAVIVVFFDRNPNGEKPEIASYSCDNYPNLPSAFEDFYDNTDV